ncbi:MAG: hypothetical protein F6K23_18540 [Okeania sp. SIO2C9]|uniref:hypothetical protein n=1 Tax=Okeania sp. SIO2C9 TaxID=2607791 RepID=UPI0013C1B9AF|nr:hypothetical protein [Okeania sp. SIO2C9]NEQ74861.1 hypothetical protein [Okeania sp. SIO2C9]
MDQLKGREKYKRINHHKNNRGANINRRGKMPVFLTGSVAVKTPKGFLTETLSSNIQVNLRP